MHYYNTYQIIQHFLTISDTPYWNTGSEKKKENYTKKFLNFSASHCSVMYFSTTICRLVDIFRLSTNQIAGFPIISVPKLCSFCTAPPLQYDWPWPVNYDVTYNHGSHSEYWKCVFVVKLIVSCMTVTSPVRYKRNYQFCTKPWIYRSIGITGSLTSYCLRIIRVLIDISNILSLLFH